MELRPREIGHVLAALCGLAALVAGIESFIHNLPAALGAALTICGLLMPFLAYRSWHKSRAAWAFLTTICGVLALCMLFGSPKVRSKLEIDMWLALLIPFVLALATVALATQHRDYIE